LIVDVYTSRSRCSKSMNPLGPFIASGDGPPPGVEGGFRQAPLATEAANGLAAGMPASDGVPPNPFLVDVPFPTSLRHDPVLPVE
jgi:hypothetical protein